jgi:hypothetical protein
MLTDLIYQEVLLEIIAQTLVLKRRIVFQNLHFTTKILSGKTSLSIDRRINNLIRMIYKVLPTNRISIIIAIIIVVTMRNLVINRISIPRQINKILKNDFNNLNPKFLSSRDLLSGIGYCRINKNHIELEI